MTADEPHTPGQCLAPAASDPRADQRIQHLTFLQAQPGHHGNRECREQGPLAADLHAPRYLPAEAALAFVGDPHPLLACLLSETLNPSRTRAWLTVGRTALDGQVGVVELADDQDLVIVCLDQGRPGKPAFGQPALNPASDVILRHANYILTAGAVPRWLPA